MSLALFLVFLYITTDYSESAVNKGNVVNRIAPWHVGIYNKIQDTQICGGTLVTKTEIISAAHCFWSSDFGALNPAQFSVAAGNLYRPWKDKRDPDTQHFEVAEIIFPDRFRLESYQDDIAIVKLSRPLTQSPYVRPICVDFDEHMERQLENGHVGIVAGWGVTEEKNDERLNYLKLPFVNKDECVRETEPHTIDVMYDQICAGDQKRKHICKNTGGSGLTYSNNSVSFLMGVSTANRCHEFTTTTFTNIRLHRTFLRRNIKDLENCHEENKATPEDPEEHSLELLASVLLNPGLLLVMFFFLFVFGIYVRKRQERRGAKL